MLPIGEVGATLGIPDEALLRYGPYKAKLSFDYLSGLADRPDGKLILVTAITPTPAGEGKTTTSVGLTDGLRRLGKRAMVCLREPSLGPCFGMKGGAAGGGYAQAAARALLKYSDLSAVEIVRTSMEIAASICIYTNNHISVVSLGENSA